MATAIFERYESILDQFQKLATEAIAAARTRLVVGDGGNGGGSGGAVTDTDLLIDELVQGYLRLPVVGKAMEVGPHNGLFYINRLGNKVYLKQYQKRQCAQDQLKGAGNFCGENHALFTTTSTSSSSNAQNSV